MADPTLAELEKLRSARMRLGGPSADDDTYGGGADRSAYVDSLDVGDAPLEEDEGDATAVARRMASYTAPKSVLEEVPRGQVDDAAEVRASRHTLTTCRLPARVAGCRPLGFPPLRSHTLTAVHPQAFGASRRIVDREDDYRKRRLNRTLSPERADVMRLVRFVLSL